MEKTVYFAKNTSELLFQLKNSQNISVVGGCTQISPLPDKMVSVRSIKDLCTITKHERYLDVGPGVTLSEIEKLGSHVVPKILYEAIQSVANPITRNMATIGGNICVTHYKMSLIAPLIALDTKLELKSQTETKIISLQNFTKLPPNYIISNIRIPLIDGEVNLFRRVGEEHVVDHNSASFAFIANTEKNAITSVRLAFAGPFAFRDKEFESSLIGQRLPLSNKDIETILQNTNKYFMQYSKDKMISDVMKQQFTNLTKYAFEQLM